MTVPKEVVAWMVSEAAGASSKAIVLNYYGIESRDNWSFPFDRWDFERCLTLLNLFPWMGVEHMRPVNEVWNGLVDNWDELDRLFIDTKLRAAKVWQVTDEEIKAKLPRARRGSDNWYRVQKEIRTEKLSTAYSYFSQLLDKIRREANEKKILKENNTVLIGYK